MTSSDDEFDKMLEEIKEISNMNELSDTEKRLLRKQIIEKYGDHIEKNESHINHIEAGAIYAPNSKGPINTGIMSNASAINASGSTVGAQRFGDISPNSSDNIQFGHRTNVNSSKTILVDNREGVIQRCDIGNSSDKPFSNCPHCGEGVNLPKAPKFCPHCGDQITV